jgi:mRNA interferase MazF
MVSRFEVYLATLDPTVGSEIRKTRPCVIISPDELNHRIDTVILAPMTTATRRFPTRIGCEFDGKPGYIVLDQLRTVDKTRLLRKMGEISSDERKAVLGGLSSLFAE